MLKFYHEIREMRWQYANRVFLDKFLEKKNELKRIRKEEMWKLQIFLPTLHKNPYFLQFCILRALSEKLYEYHVQEVPRQQYGVRILGKNRYQKRVLKNMAEHINEIAMILKEDKNDIPHNR